MFRVMKLMFRDTKLVFQDTKHKFQDLKHKFLLEIKKTSSWSKGFSF